MEDPLITSHAHAHTLTSALSSHAQLAAASAKERGGDAMSALDLVARRANTESGMRGIVIR